MPEFGQQNDPQNMNMEEKLNYYKTFLTQYTSFEILHESIEPEESFVFLAGISYTEVNLYAFFDKMTYKRENGENISLEGTSSNHVLKLVHWFRQITIPRKQKKMHTTCRTRHR